MAENQTAPYTLTEEEAVEAARFTATKRLLSRPLLPMIVVLLVIFAILAMIEGKFAFTAAALLAVLLAPLVIAATVLYVIPWQAKRHYKQAVALHEEIACWWGKNGIELSSTRGSSKFAWKDFHRWGDSHSLLLLYQSEMFYSVVPKRVLESGELAAIKRRLEDAGVPEA